MKDIISYILGIGTYTLMIYYIGYCVGFYAGKSDQGRHHPEKGEKGR